MKHSGKLRSLLKAYWLFLKEFIQDLFDERLGFYAASMSWSTLFFLIPFLVILLVLFTYLPFFDTVYARFHEMLGQFLMPTNSRQVMEYVDTFVANAGKLGIIGVGYVLIAAVLFFKDYDYIVNDIFETPQRGALQAVRTYFFLVLLLPAMLGGSFWLSALIRRSLSHTHISGFVHLYWLFPYLIIWALFYIAYQFSPRISIAPRAAALSSLIASAVWYLAKSGFFYYVLYNKTYVGIYGGLSTLLFFFLWIYISWAIFLHGLRFCYLLDQEDGQHNGR